VDLLVVVVVVLGIMVGANLLLTGAVVRRLAAHERKLAMFGSTVSVPGGLAAGAEVPGFTGETVDGRPIDAGFLGDRPWLIGFFSTTCPACELHAPEFAAVVADGTSGLAVVSGEGGDELFRALGSVPVVRESTPGGPIVTAFEVDTYPTFYVVESGRVSPVGSAAEARGLLASGVRSA
jgi:hypothetical protein